jgi:hypothetical protein
MGFESGEVQVRRLRLQCRMLLRTLAARRQRLFRHLMPAFALALLIAVSLAPENARGDGPKDNDVRNVRPVRPPGFEIDAVSRARLQQSTQELAAAIEALRGRTRTRLVDAEVFQRAVDIALRYDEFFSAEDVGRAERFLKFGRDRAEALAQGDAPWLRAAGPTLLGYRSGIDGTIQPTRSCFNPTVVTTTAAASRARPTSSKASPISSGVFRSTETAS